jgi:hypothetical protein
LRRSGWDTKFNDPIPLPNGKPLVTLREAATYITKLPKKESSLPEWQAAMEALLLVAENNGPPMFARIGFMRTLYRHVVREFNPDRKDPHWGKRKLKRDGSRSAQDHRFLNCHQQPQGCFVLKASLADEGREFKLGILIGIRAVESDANGPLSRHGPV